MSLLSVKIKWLYCKVVALSKEFPSSGEAGVKLARVSKFRRTR